jgi:hypothetical protein
MSPLPCHTVAIAWRLGDRDARSADYRDAIKQPPGHRDRARGQGTVSVSVPVSVSVSVSTTLSHEARRANAFGSQGQTWYLPVDNVNGYCRPLSPALLF